MFVSVNIVALFFSASTIESTASSDIFNISKYSKSAVVCIARFIIFSSTSFLNSYPGLISSIIPCIISKGRKGGSNLAAAIVNAILYSM